MTELTRVQDFIDTSRQLADIEQLQTLLRETRRELGFDYFSLIHRVEIRLPGSDPDELNRNELIALTDYPAEWVQEYIGRNLAALDPVILASAIADVPFRWAAIPQMIELTSRQREIFELAREVGIADGFTVPARIVGSGNGCCNFAIGNADLPRTNLLLAELVGIHAFHAARMVVERAYGVIERPRLSPRQRDCVELVGRGKTDWEIAKILAISPATVKDYLDDARRKYGVSKRVQIVLRAVFDGQMALSSLVQ